MRDHGTTRIDWPNLILQNREETSANRWTIRGTGRMSVPSTRVDSRELPEIAPNLSGPSASCRYTGLGMAGGLALVIALAFVAGFAVVLPVYLWEAW